MMRLSDVRSLGVELSNWGRWGPDDERGTLNFVTRERVRAAATLVVSGEVVRCGLNYDATGPFGDRLPAGLGRFNARHRVVHTGNEDAGRGGLQFSDEIVEMPLQSVTQWDALAHVHYDGMMYNGAPASAITAEGAAVNSIDRVAAGIVGRGVLLDIARHRGTDSLGRTDGISAVELDECAREQGVRVESGDIVCVRTGFVEQQLRDGWAPDIFAASPGLRLDCARWLAEQEIAAVAGDCVSVEAHPSPDVEDCLLPMHQVCIRDMGMTFGEFFHLGLLAERCAQRGSWEFLFAGAPLPVTGAVGSPVNPLAML
jgi:kynurenine formamidase